MNVPLHGDVRPLRGRCRVPGDKAISHRAAILAALAVGTSRIRDFSPAGDCRSTLGILWALGVQWSLTRKRETLQLVVLGKGPEALEQPPHPIDCGRSATTMRLGAGVAAGMASTSTLTGHPQLLRRPMSRVAEPLRLMGADIGLADGGRAPITVRGGGLVGIEYRPPVASAQVKSAMLLAGLRASGTTIVVETTATRDHTERLLLAMGAQLARDPGRVSIVGSDLGPLELRVPGDVSSAAPLIAAALLVPGSDAVIERVGLNPGRTGFLSVLERMGARVELVRAGGDPERWGDVRVRHGPLEATRVDAREVPATVDELPLLGVLGTQAEGVTEVRGAAELRVKESDRIAGVVAGLRAIGADAEEMPDGFVVRGPTPLTGGRCEARGDHRLGMAFTIGGLVASGPVAVEGMSFVDDSFPGFERAVQRLMGGTP